MIKFLQKKYKLILLIVATLACVLFSSTVYAWESPNHEQFKMSQFKQSQSTDGGTDTEDLYTIESIIFNKIPFLDPNIFSNKFEEKWKDKDGNEHDYDGYVKGSINYFIKTEITKWYVTMRNLVAAVVIIMGIYTGIRMAISTVAEEKAKYKEMIFAWIKSLVLVFGMHLILIAVLNINGWIIDELAKELASTEEASIYYIVKVRAYDIRFSVGMPAMIIYIVLVYCYLKFLWRYVKRFFKILTLIIIAPIVAGRYAFDAPQGKNAGGAYRNWLFDFTKTVFIQTVHVVEYTIFMRIALNLIETKFIGFIYAIMFIFFMLDSEKIVMMIFNFGDHNDRTATLRTGFRKDMHEIKSAMNLGISFASIKSTYKSYSKWSKGNRDKFKEKFNESNENRRKKNGKYTGYDKLKSGVNNLRRNIYDKRIDNEFLAINSMSDSDKKELQDTLRSLQRGDINPADLSARQKDLISKLGINPNNITTRNKLKDLIDQRKGQRRFSKDRLKTNALLGANAAKYGYGTASRKIKGVISSNKYLSKKYKAQQDLLRLKKNAIGSGKDAKNSAEAIKLHKDAKKMAYKARRETVVKTLGNVAGAGTTMLTAVPIAAVNPVLGAMVIAGSMDKFKNASNPVKEYKYGKKEEKVYNKTYDLIGKEADTGDMINSIRKELNGMDDKNDAINDMEKIAKFDLSTVNLTSLATMFVESNGVGEYSEVAIQKGIKDLTKEIIVQSEADLSTSDKEKIERAVEKEIRNLVSKNSMDGKKITTKDIAKGVQSGFINATVKEEHRGLAEKISEVQGLKNDLNENHNLGKAGTKDVIKDLRKEVKEEAKYGYKGENSNSTSSNTTSKDKTSSRSSKSAEKNSKESKENRFSGSGSTDGKASNKDSKTGTKTKAETSSDRYSKTDKKSDNEKKNESNRYAGTGNGNDSGKFTGNSQSSKNDTSSTNESNKYSGTDSSSGSNKYSGTDNNSGENKYSGTDNKSGENKYSGTDSKSEENKYSGTDNKSKTDNKKENKFSDS